MLSLHYPFTSVIFSPSWFRPQISFDIHCGLLDVFVSQASVSTMLKASSLLSETLKPLSTKLSSSSRGTEDMSASKKASGFSKEGFHQDTVSFKDDLRTGNFAYIIDESGKVTVFTA